VNHSKHLDTFDKFISKVLNIGVAMNMDAYDLNSIPNWDSMSQLVIASCIHRETGHLVSAEEIKQAKTIGDLKAIYVSRL
jgi:hypothetical protein